MAKPHTELHEYRADGTRVHVGWHCQHSACEDRATIQWNRHATQAEIDADRSVSGPYGAVYRNEQGPHYTAVFCCDTHAFTVQQEHPTEPGVMIDVMDLDRMTQPHAQDCPAPDPGCECD